MSRLLYQEVPLAPMPVMGEQLTVMKLLVIVQDFMYMGHLGNLPPRTVLTGPATMPNRPKTWSRPRL